MKLLFLTPQLPYPPHQGTTIRNFNIIKHLAPRHEIHLLSFGTREELDNAPPLRDLCARISIVPYPARSFRSRVFTTLTSPQPDMALRLASEAMHAQFAELMRGERFDVVQIEGIEMARFGIRNSKFVIHNSKFKNQSFGYPQDRPPMSNLQSLISNLQSPISVFDDHNAEWVLQKSAFQSDARNPRRWLGALYSFMQWKKLERYERAVCRAVAHVFAVSDADARNLRALDAAIAPVVVPNGVDIQHYVPSDEVCAKPLAESSLVFTGKMDFRPNIDAAVWFCEEILPRVQREIPLAHIAIVGKNPSARVIALKTRGVEITGYVPDTRPYIADAAVYVVPLRMGGGTRLKVLEAMAMGKAIVSTHLGAEGLKVVPDRDLVLADTPEDFARAVVALLRDKNRRRELGANARRVAEDKYAWEKIVPKMEAVYERK
jgi:glycosyltransferase involved in cell wall biosynthesis